MGGAKKAPDPKAEAAKAAAKVEKACNDLVKACKEDALPKAKKAVEAGAELDFDATGTGSTPMHIAAGFGSYEVVKFLFSVGGSLEKMNDKKMTPLDVAVQVGEEKIVRLLKALQCGEAPPEEAPEADDDEDDDEAYPVTEAPAGVKQAAPSQQDESDAAKPEAAEAAQAQVVEELSKLRITSFTAAGKLGITLENNVVAKVGEAGTQAADQGVRAGWVLRSIGGTEVAADKAAIMKQAAAALKQHPDGVEFCFAVPADGSA
eukprot:CAMPEP_0119063900 /NCGR_PEP_ID=MMETSP1178-20130426/7117_1 /TAXON_ID=33656 /ORGANISM="unid sp, Strain CCMP2000" /LENGTH=261 /DNA_ID=CAMNT_0007045291 /DNA_START=39 /DNA_END=824 /DNA_ORIENTATION=+